MIRPIGLKFRGSIQLLMLGRAAWLLLAVLLLAINVSGKLIALDEIREICTLSAPCSGPARLSSDDARNLEEAGVTLTAYAVIHTITSLAIFLTSWLVAMIIFLGLPGKLWSLFMAFLLLYYGNVFGGQLGSLPPAALWLLGSIGLVSLDWGFTGFVLFLLLFPDGRFVPRWTRLLVPLAITYSLYEILSQNYIFLQSTRFKELLPDGLLSPLPIILVFTGLMAQLYRYLKVSNLQQRRQTKWVVYGGALAVFLLVTVAISSFLLTDSNHQLFGLLAPILAPLIFTILPVSLGIAILRSQLWDIDIIIRKSLVYGLLVTLLAVVYFGSVITLQGLFAAVAGQESPVVIVISTLLIAALFAPLRSRIKDTIDRRFYRRKYNAAQILDSFTKTARDEVDIDVLSAELLKVVQESVQPAQVFIWLKQPNPTSPIEDSKGNKLRH